MGAPLATVLIESLDDLIHLLDSTKVKDFKKLDLEFNLSHNKFDSYASWNSNRYTRNCIVKRKHYELILLCWSPNQSTKIHCHGGEECWVYLIDGKIEENLYDLKNQSLELRMKRQLGNGKISYMNDSLGFHSLHNVGGSKAMTLHLYMNPIESCTYYNEATDKFIPKSMKFD